MVIFAVVRNDFIGGSQQSLWVSRAQNLAFSGNVYLNVWKDSWQSSVKYVQYQTKRRRLCPVLKLHVVNVNLHIDTVPVVAPDTLPAYQLTYLLTYLLHGAESFLRN